MERKRVTTEELHAKVRALGDTVSALLGKPDLNEVVTQKPPAPKRRRPQNLRKPK
jgi:hypothetical protein